MRTTQFASVIERWGEEIRRARASLEERGSDRVALGTEEAAARFAAPTGFEYEQVDR